MTAAVSAGPQNPAGFFPEEIAAFHHWRAYPVGPFPLSDDTTAPNGIRCTRGDVGTVQRCFRHVPSRMFQLVRQRYEGIRLERSHVEANAWAYDVAFVLGQGRAHVAESEDEIRRCAKARAEEAARMLSRSVLTSATVLREQLNELLQRWAIPEQKKLELPALCARITDETWWRRKLRAHVARLLENFARDIGAVHRRAGVYVSDDAQHRHGQRQRRARKYFEGTDVVNLDTGESVPMAEVVKGSLSNPKVRRDELMARMRGFEEYAKAAGHIGMFYTLTAPSKFHAVNHDGTPNEKHDGSSPSQAQAHLCGLWKRFRSVAHRRGIRFYGFRVAEAHHDGTPHWHLVLFVHQPDAGAITEEFRALALEVDGDEPGAQEHRFKEKFIDPAKGSATGYLAKYIAKNIDGFQVGEDWEAEAPAETTADRARAWASTHGIRQFQQIGGPGVGVWRELRRLREAPKDQVIAAIWGAADAGEWRKYVDLMGGAQCARKDRPLATWTVSLPGRVNRYHEPAAPRVRGVARFWAPPVVTRPHEWALRPCRGVPWTRGNNCTATETGGHRVPPNRMRTHRNNGP